MAIDTGPVRPDTTLQVEPARLGVAAIAFRDAARRVDRMLVQARRNLSVEPAMGDLASMEFAAYATESQVGASGSFVHVFERYRDELLGIAAVLEDSKMAYERTEAVVAASWS